MAGRRRAVLAVVGAGGSRSAVLARAREMWRMVGRRGHRKRGNFIFLPCFRACSATLRSSEIRRFGSVVAIPAPPVEQRTFGAAPPIIWAQSPCSYSGLLRNVTCSPCVSWSGHFRVGIFAGWAVPFRSRDFGLFRGLQRAVLAVQRLKREHFDTLQFALFYMDASSERPMVAWKAGTLTK